MNILCDYIGHEDLFYSLHLLIERRLGWNLFFPYGEEWQKQFNIQTSTFPADVIIEEKNEQQLVFSKSHNYIKKGILYKNFSQFDFVISTAYFNEIPMLNLGNHFGISAIRQIANIGEESIGCKNILLATTTSMKKDINWIQHFPEHHINYTKTNFEHPKQKINSYFNNFYSYPQNVNIWDFLKENLINFEFNIYGNIEGKSINQKELPDHMNNCMFVYHNKPLGCCGYTARQALACGKPLIVDKRHCRTYKTLANEYLIDKWNCIDLDPSIRSLQKNIELIREWSKQEIYKEKSINACNTFSSVFNFEINSENIKKWLLNLRK